MEDLQEEGNKRARRPWMVIWSIVVVLLVVIGVFIFMDDAPPDDSWLLPKVKPEPVEKNPLVLFCEMVEAHPIEGYTDLIKAAKEFKNIPTEDMRAFVGKHTLQGEAFEKLMLTDQAVWRWPGLAQDVSFVTSFKYLTSCQEIASQLRRMKTELLVRAGKADEAVTEALKTTRFGHGINAPEGFLIPWLVGMTCQRIGETGLQSALTLPGVGEETLCRAQEARTPLDPGFGQLRRILPWEYLGFKNTLALAKSGGIRLEDLVGNQSTLISFFLRKNRTLSNYLILMRPVYEAAGKDWPALLSAAVEEQRRTDEWQEHWFRFNINPNVGGNMLLSMSGSVLVNICKRGAASSALHRQVVIMIALRRCELADGKLPEKLDALVPKYLPAVPLDPFDNTPMRWDAATGAIYSVGADFKDDHGSFSDPYKSDNKDVGMHYWWKSKVP